MSSPANNIKPEFTFSPLKFNPLKAFNFTPLQVSRVSQLDSQLLDKELQNLLKDQFWQSFTLLKSTFKSKFEGEVSLILKSLCFYFSMIKNSATDPSKGSYGNKLQNLKFNFGAEENKRETKSFINKKIVVFYFLSIGLPYLLNKLLSYLQKNQWNFEENSIKQKLLLGLQKFQSFLKYASFLNYCAFLVDGKYLTLVGRVLRMRLVYDKKLSNRQISYEFLNRQLIWDAFSEFLMFLIPLINIQKLQTNFRKLVQSKSKSSSDNSTILSKLSSEKCAICYYEKYLNASSMDLGQGGNDQLNAKFLGDEDCTLQLAYQANCGHLFCYACISTNLKQDSDYCCIVCDQRVTNIERYNEVKE